MGSRGARPLELPAHVQILFTTCTMSHMYDIGAINYNLIQAGPAKKAAAIVMSRSYMTLYRYDVIGVLVSIHTVH